MSKITARPQQYQHSLHLCTVGFHNTLAAYQWSAGTLCDGKQANQPLQAIHRRRRWMTLDSNFQPSLSHYSEKAKQKNMIQFLSNPGLRIHHYQLSNRSSALSLDFVSEGQIHYITHAHFIYAHCLWNIFSQLMLQIIKGTLNRFINIWIKQ